MEPIRLWRVWVDGYHYTDDETIAAKACDEELAALPRADFDALVRRVENAEVAARVCRSDAEANATRAEDAERDNRRLDRALRDESAKADAATARAEKAERERDEARAIMRAAAARIDAALRCAT